MAVTGQPLGAVVILGLPGVGKTTLAKGLAQRCGARLVSRDETRLAMFGPCSSTDGEKKAAFAALIGAVTTNCALGHLSIVEGMPFSRYAAHAVPHDRDPALAYTVDRRFREPPPSTLQLDACRDPEELVNAVAECVAACALRRRGTRGP